MRNVRYPVAKITLWIDITGGKLAIGCITCMLVVPNATDDMANLKKFRRGEPNILDIKIAQFNVYLN